MTAALSCRDVAVARGGRRLLAGITLSLNAGDLRLLRGANGIGKTTLLRTLAGLQPPVAGVVDTHPETIAYAAHADGLKAVLSVAENLDFWADLHGQSGIDAALAAFDLSRLRDRRAADLSAGQKRRVGLARLLVTGRPVWLLDEPTVSLDATGVAQFGAAVQAHLAQGGAALIATHIDLGFEAAVLQLEDYAAAGPDDLPDDPFLQGAL